MAGLRDDNPKLLATYESPDRQNVPRKHASPYASILQQHAEFLPDSSDNTPTPPKTVNIDKICRILGQI